MALDIISVTSVLDSQGLFLRISGIYVETLVGSGITLRD